MQVAVVLKLLLVIAQALCWWEAEIGKRVQLSSLYLLFQIWREGSNHIHWKQTEVACHVFYCCPRTIKVTANASVVPGCLEFPASCLLPPLLPSKIKTMSLQRSYSCSKLRFLRGWDSKMLHLLDHNCFVALCGWCVWLFRCSSRETRSHFLSFICSWTQTHRSSLFRFIIFIFLKCISYQFFRHFPLLHLF